MSELLAKLAKRFDPRDIKTRTQGGKELQYVDIASTINRLNEVLDFAWDWHITRSEVSQNGETDRNGKPQYMGMVEGFLSVAISPDRPGVVRSGVGVGVNGDPDTALKTADAEALKKAGHKFGIGLELWDEDVRSQNEVVRRAVGSEDIGHLKRGVFELALIAGSDASPEAVAEHFHVAVEDLQDAAILKAILSNQEVKT